jgi:hypothetical protein
MDTIKDIDEPVLYQFRLKGRFNASRRACVDGFHILPHTNGETLLVGPLNDPADLQDLLVKIRQLGLPFFSIHRLQKNNSG